MKNVITSCVAVVLVAISMAFTVRPNDETQQGSSNLVGKWKFAHFKTTQYKNDQLHKQDEWSTADRKIEIYWEFKSNGDLIATEKSTTANGKWKLEVLKKEGSHIKEGKLTLWGFPGVDELAKMLDMKQLTYNVRTVTIAGSEMLVAEVDASKASPPGLKTIFAYSYKKL